MPNLVEIIQEIVKNTNNAITLADILPGTVTSITPLKIYIEQKMELPEDFFILTKNVKDYTVDVTMDWSTENEKLKADHNHTVDVNSNISVSSDISPNDDNQKITNNVTGEVSVAVQEEAIDLTHKHNIKGTKSITIHNALKVGDRVILIQQMGGQKFVVLDKIS
mgnify:CR=1 FL=1